MCLATFRAVTCRGAAWIPRSPKHYAVNVPPVSMPMRKRPWVRWPKSSSSTFQSCKIISPVEMVGYPPRRSNAVTHGHFGSARRQVKNRLFDAIITVFPMDRNSSFTRRERGEERSLRRDIDRLPASGTC